MDSRATAETLTFLPSGCLSAGQESWHSIFPEEDAVHPSSMRRTTRTPLYLAVGAALIAHLGNSELDWVGTSLGGHIGMELAARPGSPIRRLVLNDFGARVPAAALQRIGSYHKIVRTFSTLNEAETYLREIYAPFGPLSDVQWRHIAEHSVIVQEQGTTTQLRPQDRYPVFATAVS